MTIPRKTQIFSILLFLSFVFIPIQKIFAQETEDQIFKAKVVEIIQEIRSEDDNGRTVYQQKLKLKNTTDTSSSSAQAQDEVFEYDGITYEMARAQKFELGDKVIIRKSIDQNNEPVYSLQEYARNRVIYLLLGVSFVILLLIAKLKGLRAAISLTISFLIILKFILPQILAGNSPIIITIIGSFFILVTNFYLTYGWNKKTHIAFGTTIVGVILVGILSVIFSNLARLTGLAHEEDVFLLGLEGAKIVNFEGLLLAGFIIGALGALDDITISQTTAIAEFAKTEKKLKWPELYKKSMKLGIAHINSMVNTLFLAYAGVSLPILLLLISDSSINSKMFAILSNEALATEIIRTFVGVIGIILLVPLSSLIGAYYFGTRSRTPNKNQQFLFN